MIRKRGSKYAVLSAKKGKNGKLKRLGSYRSLAAAKKRLRQVEYFKHKRSR